MDAVGVDIERNTHQINSSTAFFLSKIEQQKLSAENLGNTYLLKKWVQKEAVSKAIGKGLSLGFHTIESSGTYCFWRNEKFMTHEVNVHPDYYCYVAGKTGKTKPEVSEISFEKLLNNLI
ncbi:4'-phosphopantetheinyl transferase family protein [Pseudarcicella hirudinis]